ncbi:carboxylase:pyruvate/acetyl-coa/propionyl-CoA [Pleurotus eryngii]|uniref:Carboxylase:pyruvate/acetyl-coa/propionyl-CoA n=1 Tax=Pleurotus eryngii TaxID=5323 RepID=A0A9P6DFN2_PLEER|nr:carboxylase:pyruvate/acetyl-coa/propionyl-CoA [Pleurotus eryngii]
MPKVLVANRGEIAIRILRAAEELGWETATLFTDGDTSHTTFANEAVKLDAVSDFLNIQRVVEIAKSIDCTHIHPGYGFLSESPVLAAECAKSEPPIVFIGPSIETLRIASDKMLSRELASSANVNIAAGTRVATSDDVRAFVAKVGYPVMIKALDGGGGRGIRVVEQEDTLEESFKRCMGESPSHQLFVEKALTGPGWKHIEVQIIGDGQGGVAHLWERECSVQRRFQKIVEAAPSSLPRSAIQPLFDASLKLATKLQYKGLGTFEYLVNAQTLEWAFLEINPRVQVEHTITEEITNLDLVRSLFLLSLPSTTLSSLGISSALFPSHGYAIQLRITAEDPLQGFRLSPGKITPADITWPAGRGVRIDTWLNTGPGTALAPSWTVGADFDSLLAKIIVRGATFEEATQKGLRALKEFKLAGEVTTNVELLAGVLKHASWQAGKIHTLWLESSLDEVMGLGKKVLGSRVTTKGVAVEDLGVVAAAKSSSSATVMLQPGTVFNLSFTPEGTNKVIKHAVSLSSLAHNAFPDQLSGTLLTSLIPTPLSFNIAQSASAAVSSATGVELADPNNASHIGSPLTGRLVEMHAVLTAEDGPREVKKGDTLAVLSVMKMESSVLAPFSGVVERRGKGLKAGIIINEGVLLAILNPVEKSRL